MILKRLLKLLGFCAEEGASASQQPPNQDKTGGAVKRCVIPYVIDKTDRYRIEFRPQADGTIKLFALSHPADPWAKPVSENHLYSSGEVCVTVGREPRSLDRARAIAMVWAKGFSIYCRTGQFPTGSQKVNVPDRAPHTVSPAETVPSATRR
jgi:hypothetical protein